MFVVNYGFIQFEKLLSIVQLREYSIYMRTKEIQYALLIKIISLLSSHKHYKILLQQNEYTNQNYQIRHHPFKRKSNQFHH